MDAVKCIIVKFQWSYKLILSNNSGVDKTKNIFIINCM